MIPVMMLGLGYPNEKAKANGWHYKRKRIEEDLQELAEAVPDATTIQLLSANPLCMTYNKPAPTLEKINHYLPKIEYIYAATRQRGSRPIGRDPLLSKIS